MIENLIDMPKGYKSSQVAIKSVKRTILACLCVISFHLLESYLSVILCYSFLLSVAPGASFVCKFFSLSVASCPYMPTICYCFLMSPIVRYYLLLLFTFCSYISVYLSLLSTMLPALVI